MSEDIKQFTASKEYEAQQGAFEDFIIDKYKQWNEHTKTPLSKSDEQKGFEDYLKNSDPLKNRVKIIKHTGGNKSFEEFVRLSKERTNWSVSSDSASAVQSQLKAGEDYIILMIEEGKISNALKTSMVIYGKYMGAMTIGGYTVSIAGLGYSTGIKTFTQEEIEEKIKHNTPVGPAPSASINYININNMNRKSDSEWTEKTDGEYGVNLIDYRHLSKSPQLGLTGQYIKVLRPTGIDRQVKLVQEKTGMKTIYNKYDHKNQDGHSKYNYGGTIGISGIKKGVNITFSDTWKPTPEKVEEDKGQLLFTLFKEETQGGYKVTEQHIQFDANRVESHTEEPTHHGLYQIELGTNPQGHGSLPDKYTLEFTARYGTLEPNSYKRNFVFKNHNGVILRANHYIKDEFAKHKMGNVLKRKVGVVKATELEWFHGLDLIGDQAHYIYAKVPFDCKVPKGDPVSGPTQQQMVDLGKKLMSNNLTEIAPDKDEHLENLPYHKNPPYLEQTIVPLPYTQDKIVWCFLLITSPENAKRYHELLSETEITYELADEYQTVEYLKQGGFVISLTNGELIHSYDYVKIDKKEAESAYELTDVNGKKIKINMAQIVAVYPNE